MGKKKAARLSKRLARDLKGVRLPKELRKGAAGLVAAAASPAGQELIAGALALAAAAIKAQARRQRAAAAPAASPLPAPPGPPAATDPHEIGVELGRMAEAALAGLFGGRGKRSG